jgi:chitin synthase
MSPKLPSRPMTITSISSRRSVDRTSIVREPERVHPIFIPGSFPVQGQYPPLVQDNHTIVEHLEDHTTQLKHVIEDQYHYPPPQQYTPKHILGVSLFRYKTQMMIPLTTFGNLVVDVPVPEKVLWTVKRMGDEFTHLRYSAIVGDPNAFQKEGYTLRQEDTKIEIFIVVTMYNEPPELFLKTWNALERNIEYLCKDSIWGVEGWTKVVICIVSDGRENINPKTLAVIGLLGIYQEGLITTSIDSNEVSAHLFEYTTHVRLDNQYNFKRGGNIPIQTIFCLKEKNGKKINSHRWFFNAFSAVLVPEVCVLIDVGTKPSDQSLYHLWNEFHVDENVGGACGEIYVDKGRFSTKLLNPLVAAQNFEYKISNILDKPMESQFGFIAVLPGAFSAYRYKALLNGHDGQGPLEKYFLGESMEGNANLVMANMYLAEDRILCFELVTKRNEKWVLRYVHSARAETDVPDSVPEYVSQRRRWLNGSFFAGLHAIIHFYQIFRSGHRVGKKLILCIQLLCKIY